MGFVPPRFQVHPITYPRPADVSYVPRVSRILDGMWNKPYRHSHKEDEMLAFFAAPRTNPYEGFRSWKTRSSRTFHKWSWVEDDDDNFGPFDDLSGLPRPSGLGRPATS